MQHMGGAVLVGGGAEEFVETEDEFLEGLEGFEEFVDAGVELAGAGLDPDPGHGVLAFAGGVRTSLFVDNGLGLDYLFRGVFFLVLVPAFIGFFGFLL